MQGVSLRQIPDHLPGAGIKVVRLHYSADPRMTPDAVKAIRKTYSSDARWRREMEIEYEALEGELLYPEFNFERNVCESFDVSDPEFWTIYQACDPHGRTPHAHVWRAFNSDGDHVVCGELWPNIHGLTVREYAESVLWLESDSEDKPQPFEWCRGKNLKIYYRTMDTHGSAVNSDEGVDIFESYRRHGLIYQSALKGSIRLETARDRIADALLPKEWQIGDRIVQLPRMRVFEFCSETIAEFQNVRFPEGDAERPSDEKPMTYRKHCLDGIHYIETARPRFVTPKKRGSKFKVLNKGTGY